MESKDTGKVRLRVVDNRYLHIEIYTDDELTRDEIEPITDFLDQFDKPVPALIERQGRYSISLLVQIAMMKQTKHRLRAVAYIERDHIDAVMSRIAANTYFREVEVKSFYDRSEALEWLSQYFTGAPLIPQSQDQVQA
jgi:hypothetical protein